MEDLWGCVLWRSWEVFFCTDEKTGMVCLVVVTCYKSPVTLL